MDSVIFLCTCCSRVTASLSKTFLYISRQRYNTSSMVRSWKICTMGQKHWSKKSSYLQHFSGSSEQCFPRQCSDRAMIWQNTQTNLFLNLVSTKQNSIRDRGGERQQGRKYKKKCRRKSCRVSSERILNERFCCTESAPENLWVCRVGGCGSVAGHQEHHFVALSCRQWYKITLTAWQ